MIRRFRCYGDHCRIGENHREFTSDWRALMPRPACPHCGSVINVVPLIDVHLIVADPQGKAVQSSGNYRVKCNPDASMVDTSMEAWTTAEMAVSCPKCLEIMDQEDGVI